MIIPHPLLGARPVHEFFYLGDAVALTRPDGADPQALEAFTEYLYIRDNPAGLHRELWYHEQGDHSWLVITRDTRSHEITEVVLARDYVLARQERAGAGS